MHKFVGLVMLLGAFALLLLGATPSTGAQGAVGRPAAPPAGAITPTATATAFPHIFYACPHCVSYGIGNPTAVAVGNGPGPGNCPNCSLVNEKFWLSIAGPGTDNRNGEPYNTRYIHSEEGFDCTAYQLNIATPNPAYVAAPNPDAGYNYAVYVDATQSDVGLYVYDPAQYYRSGVNGTDADTGDTQACASQTNRFRFRTYFQLYQPDNTPDNFDDDVPLGPPVSFQDDGTTTYHDKWFLVGTLPASLAATGHFRLQVYTDDLNSSNTYGMGDNQFALALGGPRESTNIETINPLGSGLFINLPTSATSDVQWYMAAIQRAPAGEQVSFMLYDPGDTPCNTNIQLFLESDPVNPVDFDLNWTGQHQTSLVTTDTSYPPGDPRRQPYKGQWVTLGVTVPPNLMSDFLKIKYRMAGCGSASASSDRLTWQMVVSNPPPPDTETPTPTDTPSPTSTPPPTATATPIPWVDLSCPTCMAYGIGNPTPVAVGNGPGPGNCPNCQLQNQKFWASIAGPGSDDRNGDPYNTRYIHSEDGFVCGSNPQLNTATPNPTYVAAPNPEAGYNYAIKVDPSQGDLGLYVYDPAQYYRSGLNGTGLDTGDTQACAPLSLATRFLYRTYFQLWQPDNTPYIFTDDVPLGSPVSFQDDGTPATHNKWFLVGTMPASLAVNGRFRLQVTTDDVNSSGIYGMGANQYSLALGGLRAPANNETISTLGPGSLFVNIRQVSGPDPTWYLARIGGEHAGEQVSIQLFDPGDANCTTSIQLFRESDPVNPVPFDLNWTGLLATRLITTDTSYPPGDPRRQPYNGEWVTLGVTLPANYTDDYWQIKYTMAGCGGSSTDVITWQAFYGGPAGAPSATATPFATAMPSDTPLFTPTNTPTPPPTFTPMATNTPTNAPTNTPTDTPTFTPTNPPTYTATRTPVTTPPTVTATATPTLPVLPIVCLNCASYGLGNPTPVIVGTGFGPGNCPNCSLVNEKFWASIDGPGSDNLNGDPYNTKFINSELGFDCTTNQLNTATPNPAYVAGPSTHAGYNYSVLVDASAGDINLYVYDPAQYYRQGVAGTASDTGDTQLCAPVPLPTQYRYRTYFQIYQPDNTPGYYDDDVPLGPPISFQDDGTTTYHNKWFLLGTLPAGLADTGNFRLQVYTDDVNSSGTYGNGANQYSLALGGPRMPDNLETISPLVKETRLNNIRAANGDLSWSLTLIGSEHAGERIGFMFFDPGDANCNTSIELVRVSDPTNPVPFDLNWTGTILTDLVTTDTAYPPGDPRRQPYNGGWVTLGVTLPSTYTDDIWQIKYVMGGCASTTTDKITWQAVIAGLGATPTATVTSTGTPGPSATPAATACPIQFVDVPGGSTFYDYIRCLACRGIVGGYPCGGPGEPCPGTYYRPNNNVTRGQLAKIIASAAGLSDPVSGPTFEDVPSGSTFYTPIEQLAGRGVIGGYACGGPFEPCVAPGNRPYYRPGNPATRGQIAKIVSNTAQFTETPTGQTFEDVPPGSTFYLYIERIAGRGIVTGYPCGGAGEPCVPPGNRPYFRPNTATTRGQLSKIAAATFLPNCQTPGASRR